MSSFKIEDGKAVIDVYELLHAGIPDYMKQDLAESLTCSDYVIKAVTDQLLEGWTDHGFHGGEICTTNPDNYSPLQKARRRIAVGASDVAKTEIERLERKLQLEAYHKQKYMNLYFDVKVSQYNPDAPMRRYK